MVSKTVVVIEDEEFISNSNDKALKKEGYGVITTSDYSTSINVIDGAMIDLVVSDVMLPFAGGIDIVEHIKNSPKLSHIPILLVTGMDRDILYSSKILPFGSSKIFFAFSVTYISCKLYFYYC